MTASSRRLPRSACWMDERDARQKYWRSPHSQGALAKIWSTSTAGAQSPRDQATPASWDLPESRSRDPPCGRRPFDMHDEWRRPASAGLLSEASMALLYPDMIRAVVAAISGVSVVAPTNLNVEAHHPGGILPPRRPAGVKGGSFTPLAATLQRAARCFSPRTRVVTSRSPTATGSSALRRRAIARPLRKTLRKTGLARTGRCYRCGHR